MNRTVSSLFVAGAVALFALALPMVTPSTAAGRPATSIGAQRSNTHPRAHHRKGHRGHARANRHTHRRRRNNA